jgi:hypothetical protein
MVLADGRNSNLQFMANNYVCTEYIGGYVGKVDLPESNAITCFGLRSKFNVGIIIIMHGAVGS